MSTPPFRLDSRCTVSKDRADFIVAQGVQRCLKTPDGTIVMYQLGKTLLVDSIRPTYQATIEDLQREVNRVMSVPKDFLCR